MEIKVQRFVHVAVCVPNSDILSVEGDSNEGVRSQVEAFIIS